MADRPMGIAPLGEPMIDVVLVGVDHRPGDDDLLDQRADRLLLDVGQHVDDDLAGPLDHPEDRRLLLLQRPPPRRPLQPPAPAGPPFFLTASGWPLWPATTYTSSHSTSPLRMTSGLRTTTPSRSTVVIRWASSGSRSSSLAICSLERSSPMRYSTRTQTRSGWWCPAKIVSVRSSKRRPQARHSYRCRCGSVS